MNQNNNTQQSSSVIIPPNLAIRAMRDSGYRNTAYALAELIDNSIQADASFVDVICIEESIMVSTRKSRRITAIGVLDDGEGMKPDILQIALQFGNGTHLSDTAGIGRFGMGLPNSSISQCRKVEVWTWQNGPDNAIYTYLDVDQIENGSLSAVPVPRIYSLPEKWRGYSKGINTTGTFVLWTNFDDHRLSWRGALATFRNTETIVGRMYRKFIDSAQVNVRFITQVDKELSKPRYSRVNDPLYLMKNSSTPPPFDQEPMFQPFGKQNGEASDEVFEIEYGGDLHEVVVRISYARPETVTEDRSDRGSKPYGKHAAKNIGVSIIREGRELDLDSNWANNYDPTERWWGIEVEFPSALDEVFGVTNNKQSATIFSQMAQFDWEAEAKPGEYYSDFKKRIGEEGDPRSLLIPIVEHIREQIPLVRKYLKKQTEGSRKKNERHDKPSVEDLATSKFKERAEQGHETDVDRQDFNEESKEKLKQDLIEDKHYPSDIATKIASAILKRKRRVTFLTKAMDGYGFFNVEHKHGGVTAIVFNTNHPLFEQLVEVLDPKLGEETDADLIERIHKAADTLELLFAAWARYELEEIPKKNALFEMRQEWGKMAQFFLNESGQ